MINLNRIQWTALSVSVFFVSLPVALHAVPAGADDEKPLEAVTAPAKVEHKKHSHKKHKHGSKKCSHKAEKHGDHTDYEDDGHHHRAHSGHYDECAGPEADQAAAKTQPASAEGGH